MLYFVIVARRRRKFLLFCDSTIEKLPFWEANLNLTNPHFWKYVDTYPHFFLAYPHFFEKMWIRIPQKKHWPTVPSRENGFSRKWVFSSKWDNFSNFLHKLKVREMGLSENGSFGRPRRKWDFDQLERKFCNLWKQGFVTLEKKMGFVTLKTYTSSFV